MSTIGAKCWCCVHTLSTLTTLYVACVAGGIVVPGAEPPRDSSSVPNLNVVPPPKTYSTRLISPASYTGYPI